MSDWTLDPQVVLVFGAQKSGKTSYCFRYLLNADAVCRFIFDDRGQAQKRLKLKPCGTARECEEALKTGWVCFNPHVMFKPIDDPDPRKRISAKEALQNAFKWFCDWMLKVSARGAGQKVFFADEVWQHMDARSVPVELEDSVRTGRAENLTVLLATHRPSEYHRNIRALVTEWVCFHTVDTNDLDAVRPYFSGVDCVATMPKGQFISYNREDGELIQARLW